MTSIHSPLGRSFSTSWWSATFASRCAVSRAAPLLRSLPEFVSAEVTLPEGKFGIRGTAARGALDAFDRSINIARSLPSGAGVPMEEAALRRMASAAETAGDAVRGRVALSALHARTRETEGGFSRARTAEVSLAMARFALANAGVNNGTTSKDGAGAAAVAVEALDATHEASVNVVDELSEVKGPAEREAAAALIPCALAHARASALRVLIDALMMTSAVEGGEGGKKNVIQSDAFALTTNAADSAVEVAVRVKTGPRELAFIAAVAAGARASASRNSAAAHLFAASRLLAEGGGTATRDAAASRVAGAFAAARAAANELERAPASAPPRLLAEASLSRAQVSASLADIGLLAALLTAWRESSVGGPLFPLTPVDREAVDPVLALATRDATAALSFLEKSPLQATLDVGDDACGGIARALKTLGAISLIDARAVTAEGLLRATLAAHVGGDTPAARAVLCAPAAAAAAGALAYTSPLLAQWERRERDGEKAAVEADTLLAYATGAWAGEAKGAELSPSRAQLDSRSALLSRTALAAAFSIAHIGSWGLGLSSAIANP
jgi:hypothetical protein